MIKRYVREKLKYILWMCVVTVIFALLWFFAGNDMTVAFYCVFLILFVSGAFFALDFVRVWRRHNAVAEVMDALRDFEADFPEVSGVLDNDYREMAESYRALLKSESAEAKKLQNDSIEYFTMWVHQIKTPVSALHLLLKDGGAEAMRCKQELFKIERYVDMALKYVKTEDIAGDLVLRECDVDEVVRECVKKYALLFIGKKLHVRVSETHIRCVTDEKWLAFILEQLISNAVKYTKEGGVTIEGGNGVLVIQDTGAGIRNEDLPRVFEKGYTGYNGRMDKRASGIGLYLTKKVAKALSVGVSLESAPERGTRAVVIFPKKPPYGFE